MSAEDNDPSTNSLLGRITRDLGIDQTSDINLDDVAEVIPDIANPTQVTDSETNIVYKLVADLPVDSALALVAESELVFRRLLENLHVRDDLAAGVPGDGRAVHQLVHGRRVRLPETGYLGHHL